MIPRASRLAVVRIAAGPSADCGRILTAPLRLWPMPRKSAGDVVPIAAWVYDCDMKVNGRHTRTIWLEADGWSVGIIDQTALPHRFATLQLATLGDAAHAIKSMQVRGAPLIGAAAAYGVCLALRADASDENLERAYAALLEDAADRDQSANGRSTRWRPRSATSRARRALPPPTAARRKSATRMSPSTRRSAGMGLQLIEAIAATQERRAGQRADPLQRRLARHRRLGHGDRADLHGARQGHCHPCLGRRDAAAQPGRLAHRLGARPARRQAHRHRRQHRRPPDAARHGGHGDRRHRPRHRAGRRLQQDRHVSEGARRQGQQRAVLRGAAVADHRLRGVRTA